MDVREGTSHIAALHDLPSDLPALFPTASPRHFQYSRARSAQLLCRSSPHSRLTFVSALFLPVVYPTWLVYLFLSWPVHFLDERSHTSAVFFASFSCQSCLSRELSSFRVCPAIALCAGFYLIRA